ncbi:hypothetical protein GK047_12535 [Paenibacillus sp. SYP-B3998]|uniref:Uncharacterized protein n=1 Tax=Paenibacillus sp. SYP-B3998 TaxID=2678564 RepID=A0A6G3ZXR3_9BACL|nr:hypothetical protein [Paenibacillus sp. SYP-B3998]NEW06838.1 hypothetical protein [Paenibacillus sp. SYP-B3998]
MTESQTFESPLRIRQHTAFTSIGFGNVTLCGKTAALKRSMQDALMETMHALPGALFQEAQTLLDRYAGQPGDFYRLFYVPVWSFLHVVPATLNVHHPSAFVDSAVTAHALSLFLHLWDDHLSDGQLKPDVLRLHMRTLAWQRFEHHCRLLCRHAGTDELLVEQSVADYLQAVHTRPKLDGLEAYEEQFLQEVAIWFIVPRLLAAAFAAPDKAAALTHTLERFCLAWRLVDDVQDIHLDLEEGKRTSVWFLLDETGRNRWDLCQRSIVESGHIAPAQWQELTAYIQQSGSLGRILARASDYLLTAAQTARTSGWGELAQELEQSNQGLLP